MGVATYLGRALRPRILPLVKFIPSLHELDDLGRAEVDELEAGHVGPAVHEALQRDVLEALGVELEQK